ncbi:MAG: dTMP kinase [Bacteroidetes bacterium]|jgi:dTMP kinase|nr:dTMP kinase [Bacteroidota bacterium]
MSFIVIEGLDGSGKSTQLKLLQNYLSQHLIPFEYLHFPRLDTPLFGELISMFLRGELGELNEVNPYLVALMYASDRHDAAAMLNKWRKDGKTIIADRYVYSNIGYQCAKLENEADREKLANWIFELEFNHYQIPKPDINIFIDVPFSFTENSLQNNRTGTDRDYLQGSKDIHEADLSFQQKVRDIYIWQSGKNEELVTVNAGDEEGNMLRPEQIFDKIVALIKTNI